MAASVKGKPTSNAVKYPQQLAHEKFRRLSCGEDDLITVKEREQMFGFWLAVVEGALIGFDAQRVIALQAMKIAAGGSSARSAVLRPAAKSAEMVTEKVSAGAEAVAILTRGGRAGDVQ
jgi:hypothetical protein